MKSCRAAWMSSHGAADQKSKSPPHTHTADMIDFAVSQIVTRLLWFSALSPTTICFHTSVCCTLPFQLSLHSGVGVNERRPIHFS